MCLPKNIHPLTRRAITEVFKFYKLTETQQKAFPLFLDFRGDKDVILQAPTGSGKSLVYLAAAVQEKNPPKKLASLVLVPNRELGVQVQEVAQKLLKLHSLNAVGLLGGKRSRNEDLEILNKVQPEILIATPGRLTHHIQSSHGFPEILAETKFLVLDEADFLLSSGIGNQLETIFDCLPKNKRTALVSATITDEVKRLASKIFRPQFHVLEVKSEVGRSIPEGLRQLAVVCKRTEVLFVLYDRCITHGNDRKIVVFFPTAQTADFAAKIFKDKLSLPVRLLHGKLTRSERMGELKRFMGERSGLLFTTDLGSRGIDFQDVDQVIQVHVPVDTEQHVHRVGRTARAGGTGEALLIISEDEKKFLQHLGQIGLCVEVIDTSAQFLSRAKNFKNATCSWASADTELIAAAEETRKSLVGYFEAGPARLNTIADSRAVALGFIKSAGFIES